MRRIFFVGSFLWALNAYAGAVNVDLGAAAPFAVLGASAVTNTGSTVLNGDLGLYPRTSITGFLPVDGGPGIVNGSVHDTDAVAHSAQTDSLTAYDFAAGESCGDNLGTTLGGLTLTPGVYCFDSTAQLTGTLTLNAEGDPNAVFVFQIGTTLMTASSSIVGFINTGGQDDANVYWQVGSSATLGTATAFEGNILASQSITLNTDATIGCGRAIALNGAVTMYTNTVGGSCESSATTPEPGTAPLLGMGLLVSAMAYCVRSRKQAG
jgi:hypothetical protein